jgi:hypothetical protein
VGAINGTSEQLTLEFDIGFVNGGPWKMMADGEQGAEDRALQSTAA